MMKPILYIVFMMILVFLYSSGVSVQFKPFHISFSNPVFGAGIVCIVIGMALCCGSTYYKGMKESGYSEGYKRGFDSGADYVIDWAKKRKEADNETKEN